MMLLDHVAARYEEGEVRCAEEDALATLHALFADQEKVLDAAIEIVGGGMVREIRCQGSKRRFWRVMGSQRQEYVCYRNFCSCRAYFEHSKIGKTVDIHPVCKHLVAIRASSLLGRTTVQEVEPAEFAQLYTAF